jgi:chorismate dehydratase
MCGLYDVRMESVQQQNLRLGVVNFLNATPLIDGISTVQGIDLVPKVPSELTGCLERGEVDIALSSSIDYQRSEEQLCILPVGALSSEGETLTVRLCSTEPLGKISVVHCDTDSHTSVALLQIILKNKYGITPDVIPCDVRKHSSSNTRLPETVLLIGDKVVTSVNDGLYPYQLDLGYAWHEQTGLPFVFATWFGCSTLDTSLVQRAHMVLDRQLRRNRTRIEQVVSSSAPERGWDVDVACRYLTENIQYSFSETHIQSLELFYDLAVSVGALESVKPLRFYGA